MVFPVRIPKHRSMTVTFLCLTCLLVCSLAFAETNGEITKIAFRAISWDESLPEVQYFDGSKVVTFFVPNGSRSALQDYQGPRQVAFYDELIWDEDGQPLHPPIAIANVPPGLNSPLFIFMTSNQDRGRPYEVMVIDDDADKFPRESYRFFNLTSRRLACLFGQERFMLLPGGRETVPATLSGKKSIEIKLAREDEEDQWELAYASKWGIMPGRRALAFIMSPPNDPREISTRIFFDYPEQPLSFNPDSAKP